MTRFTIALFLMSSFIFSCNENSTVIDNTEKNQEAESHEGHHHGDEPISLNNGEKWSVNEEMMIHVQSMEREINSFDPKSENDYKVLAKNIDKNIDLLVSSCTMKGQSHDELHKWLVPFIDLSKEFSESKTEQEFAVNLEKIKVSFVTFNTYFK